MKKKNWAGYMYRLMLAVTAVGCIVFGANGIVNQSLTSGKGSWAKAPWRVEGGDAIVLGLVFVFFGFYILAVLIRHR